MGPAPCPGWACGRWSGPRSLSLSHYIYIYIYIFGRGGDLESTPAQSRSSAVFHVQGSQKGVLGLLIRIRFPCVSLTPTRLAAARSRNSANPQIRRPGALPVDCKEVLAPPASGQPQEHIGRRAHGPAWHGRQNLSRWAWNHPRPKDPLLACEAETPIPATTWKHRTS